MNAKIERWDDSLSTHFHVQVPATFWLQKKAQLQLTKLLLRMIWGIGAKSKGSGGSVEGSK